MSLAAKLPYDHAYAGGYPGIGSQPLPTDADALDYLARVKAADGAGVEVGVATAVDAFFRDVKESGVFSSIRASCLLAGARTLAGALVPLRDYGPEIVDIDNLPTPIISNTDGSSGGWDAASRTMSNTAQTATNTSFPRFSFAISGLVAGKTYRVSARISGDFVAVGSLRLAASGGPYITDDDNDGVFEATVVASSTDLVQVNFNGNLPVPKSARIESLSIREVIASPTNVANGFVNGDFSRTSGLTGDGTSYIDSGRANNADPQNDNHNAVWLTTVGNTSAYLSSATTGAIGTNSLLNAPGAFIRNRSSVGQSIAAVAVGLFGASRASGTGYTARVGEANYETAGLSETPASENVYVYRRGDGSPLYTTATIAFYSIGTSLSLEDLDTAVTNLINRLKFALLVGENPSGLDPDTIDYIVRGYEAGGSLE